MILTLELNLREEDRTRLQAQAQQAGLALEEYARIVLERIAQQTSVQSLRALSREERNRLLAEQAADAAPLYEADLARPMAKRQLTAFSALDGEEVYDRTP